MEEFEVMKAKYKLLANHSPLLGNDSSSKLVPGYDPGHTLGTGGQEPHRKLSAEDGKSAGVDGPREKEEDKWNHLDVYLGMNHPELVKHLGTSGKDTIN
ncbi:hypothetical protein DSO57_1004380 [Entomophthora muscae]|uniref:Uncharacterized protein n=1 Tax=Entomophthora muscae TaxID=34485 RepID=A0ACC2U6C4_9FUNG|nr:hypothetical protein DSO57_1004380 [Entomophthora muscae]